MYTTFTKKGNSIIINRDGDLFVMPNNMLVLPDMRNKDFVIFSNAYTPNETNDDFRVQVSKVEGFLPDQQNELIDMLVRDYFDSTVVVLSKYDKKILEGKYFFFRDVLTIGSNGSIYFYFKNGSVPASILCDFVSTSLILVKYYVNPVVTANGTERPIYNRNQISDHVTDSKLYQAPSYSDIGTLVSTEMIGYGKNEGGYSRNEKSSIVPAGCERILQLHNQTNANTTIEVFLSFYEEDI